MLDCTAVSHFPSEYLTSFFLVSMRVDLLIIGVPSPLRENSVIITDAAFELFKLLQKL